MHASFIFRMFPQHLLEDTSGADLVLWSDPLQALTLLCESNSLSRIVVARGLPRLGLTCIS